jgi:hypothetical protein
MAHGQGFRPAAGLLKTPPALVDLVEARAAICRAQIPLMQRIKGVNCDLRPLSS